MKFVSKVVRSEKAQGLMEYVLIAIVVGLIVLFIAAKFGGTHTNRSTADDKTVGSTTAADSGEAKPTDGSEAKPNAE
jgi:hypothetical protein